MIRMSEAVYAHVQETRRRYGVTLYPTGDYAEWLLDGERPEPPLIEFLACGDATAFEADYRANPYPAFEQINGDCFRVRVGDKTIDYVLARADTPYGYLSGDYATVVIDVLGDSVVRSSGLDEHDAAAPLVDGVVQPFVVSTVWNTPPIIRRQYVERELRNTSRRPGVYKIEYGADTWYMTVLPEDGSPRPGAPAEEAPPTVTFQIRNLRDGSSEWLFDAPSGLPAEVLIDRAVGVLRGIGFHSAFPGPWVITTKSGGEPALSDGYILFSIPA